MIGRRSAFFWTSSVVGAAVAAALLNVWVRLQIISVGYDISRETQARHDLIELNQRLRLELSSRLDPAVVERTARQSLNMAPPELRNIRVLKLPLMAEGHR